MAEQTATEADRAAFIRANTRLLSPPLVPELSLHLATEVVPIWRRTEEELAEQGVPPPFWAFAWAGGQALARHVLDHPHLVAGRRVLDFGSGSGLVAIAAARAGAAAVLSADTDPFAAVAIALNAEANGVAVDVTAADLLDAPPQGAEVVLAGDIFYEKALAARALPWLVEAANAGALVLVGDPGRAYLPCEALRHLAEYEVLTTRELEDREIRRTTVWHLVPSQAGRMAEPAL